MRLNINLASQKYETVRTFVSRATVVVAVMAVVTLILPFLAWWNYSSSKSSGAQIRDLQQQIAALQQQRAEAVAVENRPENRDVTDQKNFWNRQIARKAFSWTQLFNDLQKIMPGRAYVIAVAPELTKENELKLKLTIGGEQYGDVSALLKRMEDSRRFRKPVLVSETVQKDPKPGTPMLHKFEIEAIYKPVGAQLASREGL